MTILNYYRIENETREIETARFRITGKNKILRFIERNRERIESRTKNLSIRFIETLYLCHFISRLWREKG